MARLLLFFRIGFELNYYNHLVFTRYYAFIYELIQKVFKKLQFIHSVNGYGSKTTKIIKKMILPTITSSPKCQCDTE